MVLVKTTGVKFGLYVNASSFNVHRVYSLTTITCFTTLLLPLVKCRK
jgi:hypothetical protein